jgi:hypothetical protein
MILGIILLFSSAFVFYIRGQITTTEDFLPEAEEVPLEAQPVKLFVENCIKQVGTDAVKKLGMHGGYIEPKNSTMSGTAFLTGLEPTESDGVLMFGEENSFMPYWWYLKSPNTCSGSCRFDSLRPKLRKDEGQFSVESQIDNYINRELLGCLDGFSSFREQGFDVKATGSVKTDAKVTEREVVILVTYPLEVTSGGQKTTVSSYYTKLDIRLKDIYEMALKIVEKEANTHFLEIHTMNMISSYSAPLSKDRLPPIGEYTLGAGEYIYWTRTETQKKIEQHVLPHTVSMLQVDQSRNFQRVVLFDDGRNGKFQYDWLGTALMDKTIIRLDKNYTDISADFTYLDWWNIFLNINDQEVLLPTKISIPIIYWLASNQYTFLYSIAYPVMVELKDPEAFAGEGYSFRFAMEENTRYNEPINISNYTIQFSDDGTLVCDMKHRSKRNTTIEVKDALTKGPVKDAYVMFAFGSEGCHVGNTEIDAENRSVIRTSLPVGGGDLRVSHPDYLQYDKSIFSSSKKDMNLTVELMPYKYVNVSVFSRPLNYQDYHYVLPSSVPLSALSPKETFIIMMVRQNNDSQYNYKAYAVGAGGDMATLKLVPGTYEVRGYLVLNKTVIVPAETKEYGGGIFGSSQTIPLNETVLDQWPNGGSMLNNETGYFEISEKDLFTSKKLNMYVLRFPLPITHTTQFVNGPSLEQAGELEKYSSIYRTELEPEWVKS